MNDNSLIAMLYFPFQSVGDVFTQMITAIERAEGNEPEKGGCVVS